MKKMKLCLSLLIGVTLAFSAAAQTYPTTNPTYTPNIRPAAIAIASGVANTALTLNSVGTLSVQVTGTCTSLAGKVEASNDGTNWVTLNVYPNGATVVASAATAISATGLYTANVSGLNKVRFNNTAVSGTACAATIAGSSNSFSIPR